MDARWDTAIPYYSRSGLHIEVYDTLTEFWANQDIDFMIEQAQETGGPVLELASGTGRVAWPIAQAGFDVIGLDINPGMIKAAEDKRPQYPSEVSDRMRFVHGDMTNFDLKQQFRLVYITYRSFMALMTPEAQQKCLRCIHQHLEPGGRLVINIFDPRLSRCDEQIEDPTEEMTVTNPVTGLQVEQRAVDRINDPLSQSFKMLWVISERDAQDNIVREEHERLDLRWTYRFETRYLLELCGFEVLAEFSDFEKSAPAYGKEQVWVAQKR